jgi:molybdate-binding protein/DNA-binding XRE family transcriptional regulator
MTTRRKLANRVREHRTRLGWSQEDLARRAGLSRAGISAIEMDRLVPSAAAALALAQALGCRVEDLFRFAGEEVGKGGRAWAWPPARDPSRFWKAEISRRLLHFPVEPTPSGALPHDGVCRAGIFHDAAWADPADTMILACCDPAVGLLAAELARVAGLRLIALLRSSRVALELVAHGLVHAAGVHLASARETGGNAVLVRKWLGTGYNLLPVARWEEGIASRPALRLTTARDALRLGLRWVGREPGSGARQCLDELLGQRRPPRQLASDHRSVAEAIRCGWADVGVCLRLTSEEAGLDFLGVREDLYELCYPAAMNDDPRIQALVEVVRSPTYRRLLGELPGYQSPESGELQCVR